MSYRGGRRPMLAQTVSCAVLMSLMSFAAVAMASSSQRASLRARAEVPSTDDRNCKLLGPFALITQALMGVVVVGSLVLKRQRERPKRPWKIWLLDISKQMLGQLFVHSLNVLLSWLGSRASAGEDNPCSLYFLNIAVDTTLGVLFIYYSMRFLTHYTTDVLAWPGFVSGQYYTTPAVLGRRKKRKPQASAGNGTTANPDQPAPGVARPSLERDPSSLSSARNGGVGQSRRSSNKPRLSFFFKQLALYLLSLLLMKAMVVILFALLPFLYDIGRWVLDLFGERKRAQILFVMAVFPLAMNTLQFWLIDSVLRHDPNTSKYKSEEGPYGVGGQTDSVAGPVDVEYGAHDDSLDAEYDAAISGPWTSAWWAALFGGGGRGHPASRRQPRGRYQQVGQHSIGDASSDEDDDEDDRDDEHTYPPSASQSSSVAKLDDQEGRAAQKDSEEIGRTNGEALASKSAPTADQRLEEEEEPAWDTWSDEENTPVQSDHPKDGRTTHVD